MIILKTNPQDTPFLDALEIPYCRLSGDQIDSRLVVSLEQGRSLLQGCLDKCLIDIGKAKSIEIEMTSAGVSSDHEAFFKRVIEFTLPVGFTCDFNFEVCDCGIPKVHGYVRNKDGDKVDDKTIFTLENGFGLCAVGVGGGFITAESGVHLFRQMVVANLPKDEEEKEKRYQALPEDVRKAYEESREHARGNLLNGLLERVQKGYADVALFLPDGRRYVYTKREEDPVAEPVAEEASATEPPVKDSPTDNPPEVEKAPE
ncbi:MAG: hypothetical protein UT86_C0001G0117 [Candidatus Magasanikbacteria bacterium GW2011_GWC2_40_17]|uniref:Uncharacterized protein n=1 Tax=Candidatus Magasanikbacteria bacterium GW2011_GWA2_42_32 TaxID=1619039 RepID=A0A0G1A8U8_9BACT|nr:MAG: hypothetical protein UT86_C0001G0117 [Candidatus Magasanikbacteria bacterium GW2011_GWC2_40_17]KKS57477.1 MAG: hypothetical protein UV20_C0001G0117 [Candidatus Magasanikbacteria bacterium GW2011_GWA2_42_32]OGH85193.1 MAG: hypothetical protein A2294_00390 [Candidatus Magasanikbacteria bacterium RIFOXYB2_FULL_38_10]